MAFVNPSKPAGLSPVKYLNGANYDGKVQIYSILAANTNPFYVGDFVSTVGGGTAAAGDANGIPAITLATAGSGGIGAIVALGTTPFGGPYVNPANQGNQAFRPTGAQPIIYYAAVSDDPNIIYEVQEGGAGTNLTQSSIMRNANIIYAAPAIGVFVSGTQINNATVGATATLDLKLLRLAPRTDNHFLTNPTTGGAAQKWWCLINNHFLQARPAAL
jgi:hypothetical protein